jgi:hypothetical protein
MWTTFENTFFMSVVPFDARQGKQSGSKLAGKCLSQQPTVPSGHLL